jgi:3'-5' exoribonuclease
VKFLTLSELKSLAPTESVEGEVHAQLDQVVQRQTSAGKPFYEVQLVDAAARVTLRAWSDSQPFEFCKSVAAGAFVAAKGTFEMGISFGLDAKRWYLDPLAEEAIEDLLAGSPEVRERQGRDFDFILGAIAAMRDVRLAELCNCFLGEFGDRFRRAAAARNNHHARRGGLVEHVAQMMRTAVAVAEAYGDLNRDLLVAGVLFHDCGKLWENGYPADGFTMPYTEYGEMLGHITLGIELVNKMWRKCEMDRPEWVTYTPAAEEVRLHLLHLLASHHGELQFGSPVVPKTPEAWALHYVDNLDAKMEMMRQAYRTGKPLAPRIVERVWPLPGNLVKALPPMTGGVAEPDVVPTETPE